MTARSFDGKGSRKLAGPMVIRLADWKTFIESADSADIGSPVRTVYWFRGQSNESETLRSSLARLAIRHSLTLKQTVKLELRGLDEFRRHAPSMVPASLIPDEADVIGWWSLMRHYGAPTRYLDWTRSPYVAAYFAVQQDETHDGAIWRVRWRTVIEHSEKKTPKSSKIDPQKEPYPFFFAANPPPVLRFVVPLRQTERMIAQQTGFSVSPQVLTDHDTIMTRAAAASDRKEPFLKLVVPKELKREFLRKLRRMNITAHALFPGLDGLGRSVGELIQLGADYEEPE